MDEKVVATIPPEVIRVKVDDFTAQNIVDKMRTAPITVMTTSECTLTREEVALVRKILQCANQMFTVADIDFHENKLDLLIRKLRRYEDG